AYTGSEESCSILRAWDIDVPPGALSAALEALTIACQLVRVFDCGRTPCKGDGRNQPNRQDAHISHRQLTPSRIRGCPVFRSQSSFPVARDMCASCRLG